MASNNKQPFYKKPIFVVSILLLLIIIGIVFRLLTPPPLPPTAPLLPTDLNPNYSAPTTINWQNLVRPSNLPTSLDIITTSPHSPTATSLKSFTDQLGFTAPPQVTQTQYISLLTWSSDNKYASLDQTTGLFTFSRTDTLVISPPKTSDINLPDTGSLVTSSQNILQTLPLPEQSTFDLLDVSYLSTDQTTYDLSSPNQANFLQITLAMKIDDIPIYTQELPFVKATYNLNGQLTKLELNLNLLFSITSRQSTSLIPASTIPSLSPQLFFRLYVKPKSSTDFYTGPANLSQLTPNDLKIGYFADLNQRRLLPIYTIGLLPSPNQPDYLYATSAVSQ